MIKHPNVTVKIILRYKDGVLMLKHKNGAFDFPGGRMEWGESILGALKRELKEELNYFPRGKFELFDVWNYISKDKKRHSVFIYLIHFSDKKPKLSSSEKAQILWLTKNDLLSIIKSQKFVDKVFGYKREKK